MTFRLGKVTLRIHGLLPFLWLFAWITGSGAGLFSTFLALAFHECGHLLASKWYQMRIQEIEITPYGGVISLENLSASPACAQFILAAAGPFFSLLGSVMAVIMAQKHIVNYHFAQQFARGNLILFLVNLMPALPLDGGRMMRAVLTRFIPYPLATKCLCYLGYALGISLCTLSFYFAWHGKIQLSPILAGVYLIYAAAQEKKQGTARYITSLIARRRRLESQEMLPVEFLAVSSSAPARGLLSGLSAGKYHVFYVLSEDGMEHLGTVEEKQFCDAVLQRNDQSMGQLIKKRKQMA